VTIYELTQAIVRYKRVLLGGLGILVLFVLVLTFSYEDGAIVWRGGLKYESEFQISVVSPGTESLSLPETGVNLQNAAEAYADLLASAEAAEAIGEMSGYELDESLSTNTSSDTAIISATVMGPSADLVKAATRNSFTWLVDKIQQPLKAAPQFTTVPSATEVTIDGPFSSSISVEVDNSLSSVPTDLFVLIGVGEDQPIAIPVASRAGSSVSAFAVLEGAGSLLLNLEAANGTPYDLLRLAPDPLPSTAPGYPSLTVRLGPGSIRSTTDDNGEEIWAFRSAAVTTEWIEGAPILQQVAGVNQQIQIAMLTSDPGATQIGGRRGPLIGFTVLLVGLIGMLTAVIVADTWQRDRNESEVSAVLLPTEVLGNPDLSVSIDVSPAAEPDAFESTQSDQ